MKLTSLITTGCFATFAISLALRAEDGKPNPAELMKRAQQAKAEGRYDEARELAEQVRKLTGHEKPDEPKHKIDGEKKDKLAHMRAEIEELHRAGKHEQAEELRKKFMGDLMAQHHGPKKEMPHKEPGSGDERLDHVMEAIKHLRAAKLNEPAEGLEKLAAHLKEEMAARKRMEQEHHDKKPGGEGEVRELREQVQKLSHMVEELRGQLKKQPGDAEVRKPEKP